MTTLDVSSDAERLEFVQSYLEVIDAESSPEVRINEELEVAKLTKAMTDRDVFTAAVHTLVKFVLDHDDKTDFLDLVRLEQSNAEVIEALIDVQFSEPLVEISAEDLITVGERILAGKNVAAVIRRSSYNNFEDDILAPIQTIGTGHKLVRSELFPHSNNGSGNSSIHLDNFADEEGSHYKYGLSLSRLDQGQAVFIGGLATIGVPKWNHAMYLAASKAINMERHVTELCDWAVMPEPYAPGTEQWKPRSGGLDLHGIKAPLVATTLQPGDVIFWPQGAGESVLPAWHSFKQVGHPNDPATVPRQSVSYHFA